MGPRFNGVEDKIIDELNTSQTTASMGPRFNGVEDAGPLVPSPSHGTNASMGPRFNGVEDHNRRVTSQCRIEASMGPRFNGVEDKRRANDKRNPEQLQWGHALMAWKTRWTCC